MLTSVFFSVLFLSAAKADVIPFDASFPETGKIVRYRWDNNPDQVFTTRRRGKICAMYEQGVYTFRVLGAYQVWFDGSAEPTVYSMDPMVQTQNVGVSERVLAPEVHPDRMFEVTITTTNRTCKF